MIQFDDLLIQHIAAIGGCMGRCMGMGLCLAALCGIVALKVIDLQLHKHYVFAKKEPKNSIVELY